MFLWVFYEVYLIFFVSSPENVFYSVDTILINFYLVHGTKSILCKYVHFYRIHFLTGSSTKI